MYVDTLLLPGDRESAGDDVLCDLQSSIAVTLADMQVRYNIRIVPLDFLSTISSYVL